MNNASIPDSKSGEYKSPVMLSSIMKKYGLNPKETKIVRHSLHDKAAGECFNKGYLEAYQKGQSKKVFNKAKYIMSFVGEETGTTAIFFGLYKIISCYESENGHIDKMPEGYPFPEHFMKDRYWYELKISDSTSSLKNKLKIEWGKGTKDELPCQRDCCRHTGPWDSDGCNDEGMISVSEKSNGPRCGRPLCHLFIAFKK